MWKKWFGRGENSADAAVKAVGIDPARIPRHIAIIMDGNGRWARKRGMPRTFGHRAGAEALREIVRTASQLGVGVLTAYAFSTENWKRPAEEVSLLMQLLSDYLDSEIAELNDNNVQLRFIGETAALNSLLRKKIEQGTERTATNTGLILCLAVNYGGRAEIIRAVRMLAADAVSGRQDIAAIDEESISCRLYAPDIPDPDLLIRPSGDLRMSNFLLWQAAYTELYFTPVHWPDFTPEHLVEAILDYQRRERRFGGLGST